MRLGATEFGTAGALPPGARGRAGPVDRSLGAVQSARVHLVMPERACSCHATTRGASVVVRLRPGRRLGAGEVAGVVHLVASSVPALTAARVNLVTTEARCSTAPAASRRGLPRRRPRRPEPARSRGPGARPRDARARGGRRARRRAPPPSRSTSRASERTEDHYDRDRTALRSEEQTTERVTPPGASPSRASPGRRATSARPAHHHRRPGRRWARDASSTPATTRSTTSASAASPRTAPSSDSPWPSWSTAWSAPRAAAAVWCRASARELERLAGLVRGAVGASADRGDVVTVESIPFRGRSTRRPRPPRARPRPVRAGRGRTSPPWRAWRPCWWWSRWWRCAAVAGSRTRRRCCPTRCRGVPATSRARCPRARPTGGRGRAARQPRGRARGLRSAAHARAASDPASAALVLRYWLGADGERKA